ncbi:hypothetical protein GKR71_07775 [Providencia sp. wls1922]|uniref:O-antigen ligase family protein n=1 Tax=Providencia sp. wls1922 TaxID=2675152 RepID=UPI0012B5E0AB|nr:O-antigen ligase family protein [Providencia sp. wls1922]MTC45748.1 hypothetical protein [Providencia sp. wls1922]
MRKNKFRDQLVTFSYFLVLYIPSMKYLFFSSLINIFSTALLIFSIIISTNKIIISKSRFFVVLIFVTFIFTQLLSGFNADISLEIQDIFKYISLIIVVSSIGLIYQFIRMDKLHMYIISWSNILLILYATGIISPSGAGELSYLILSMQLGIGFCAAISLAILSKKLNIFYLANAIILLLTITTLAGRTSIIISVIILVFSFLLYIKNNYNENKVKAFCFLFILLIALIIAWPFILNNVLNEYFLYKLGNMFTSGDSRFDIYYTSANLIYDNWLGIGLHKYNTILGIYPHNIFIEAMLNAGIISGLLLLIFVAIWFFLFIRNLFYCKKEDVYKVSISLISLFLFISWNTSNNITSAYVPFSAMILLIMISIKKEKQNNQSNLS